MVLNVTVPKPQHIFEPSTTPITINSLSSSKESLLILQVLIHVMALIDFLNPPYAKELNFLYSVAFCLHLSTVVKIICVSFPNCKSTQTIFCLMLYIMMYFPVPVSNKFAILHGLFAL